MSMFPSRVVRDSLRRPEGVDSKCPGCGHEEIAGRHARCSRCEARLVAKSNDSIVTKTLDGDNDLFK